MELNESEISLREAKETQLHQFIGETITGLLSLGYTLPEIVDALTNYLYLNTPSVDAVCHLTKASLALLKASKSTGEN